MMKMILSEDFKGERHKEEEKMDKKRKVILDVDTGSDDALAIMATILSPEFDIVGICTVNGNLPVPNTTENTLRVVELMGRPDIPVVRGCATPLVATLDPLRKMRQRSNDGVTESGEEVTYHSDYLPLPPATLKPVEGTNAVSWYIDTLMHAKEKITLIMVGPLTNFACAYRAEPEIINHVEEIVIMSGGHDQRNSTAASEYNVFIDPEATAIVLNCGAKITMMPLDATHKANMRPCHVELFRSWGNAVGNFVADEIEARLKAYNTMQPLHEPDIAPIHDALCVLYLLDPSVITKIKHMRCDVVCGGIADGQTLFDTRHFNDAPKNVYVCLDTDEEKFAKMLIDILSRAK